MKKYEEPNKKDNEEFNKTQEISLSTAEKIEYMIKANQDTTIKRTENIKRDI